MTKEQLQVTEARCRQFRITPAELAKQMLFGVLDHPDDDELWMLIIQNAAEAERTGHHPAWEGVKVALKKLVA